MRTVCQYMTIPVKSYPNKHTTLSDPTCPARLQRLASNNGTPTMRVATPITPHTCTAARQPTQDTCLTQPLPSPLPAMPVCRRATGPCPVIGPVAGQGADPSLQALAPTTDQPMLPPAQHGRRPAVALMHPCRPHLQPCRGATHLPPAAPGPHPPMKRSHPRSHCRWRLLVRTQAAWQPPAGAEGAAAGARMHATVETRQGSLH